MKHEQQFCLRHLFNSCKQHQVQFQTRKYDEEDRICYEKFMPLLRETLHIFCNLSFPPSISFPKFTSFPLMMSYWYANVEKKNFQLVVYLSFPQIIDKTWKGKGKKKKKKFIEFYVMWKLWNITICQSTQQGETNKIKKSMKLYHREHKWKRRRQSLFFILSFLARKVVWHF